MRPEDEKAMNLFFDSMADDQTRREEVYCGSIFVYSPFPSAVRLCEFAKNLVETVFHPHDPRTLHRQMPVEQCVEILARLKPEFIHHPLSKELIQETLLERGYDLEKTYFDVPRLRTAFPPDYLASGIAYAFHPHRDTWYSAPLCQINYWLPVYEFTPANALAFHGHYWANPVRNNSETYNYYEWNRTSRKSAANHVKTDARIQPRPQEALEPDPQTCLVMKPGGAIVFSAAQLHSTIPNTTGSIRYSIDFRVVNLDDLRNRRGAPNIDSKCTGTTLRDYLRASDFSLIPEEVVSLYFDGTETDFTPSPSGAPAGAVTQTA
jgi:hypothetical protein